MAHDVFISHAAEDRTAANAVCATLEANRIRCWIAPRDVLPSVRWADAIVEAINESRIMVLVFTSHSNNSDQVMSEVEAAVNKGIPILPLKIEDVPLTRFMQFHIAKRHWLDALTPPLERHLQYLAETVQVLLARIGDRDQVVVEAGAAEATAAAQPTVENGSQTPAPARKAPERGAVARWGSQRTVLLAAVSLGLAGVVALILFLVVRSFGGGEGAVVVVPTSTRPPPLVTATMPATSTLEAPELGTYSGTTSQGRSVEFDVIEGSRAIGRIKIDVEGECPLPTGGAGPQPTGCTCEVKQETKMTKPWPIADTGFSYAPGDFEFSAVFDSSTTASGFVRVHTSGGAQAPCSSDQVTWTASLEQVGRASPGALTPFVSPSATAVSSASAGGPSGALHEGPWPRFWLTLPDVPPDSWSTSVPRGMNVYQTAFVSWQDPAIGSWLADPQSALPDGEYYLYLLRGATADAPKGAKVSVSVTIHDPDSVVGIGVDQGTFTIREDGTWQGHTQVFPDDIGRSTYTLQMEIRSADNELLLRASLTISPE